MYDLENIINRAKGEAGQADIAIRYFNGQHDILDNKIMYYNDNDQLVESPYASNFKLPNAFFNELVTQSTDFIFGESIKFNTDDTLLKEALSLYITSETHQLLYEAVEEASKKGKEWIYAYQDEQGLVNFMRVDSRQIAEVVDEYGRQQAVIRYLEDEATVWGIDGTIKKYQKDDKGEYKLTEEDFHTVYDKKTGKVISGYGRIPLFKLKNNKDETSDLDLIKRKIDDYDRMDSYATNDLQDFRSNVHILTGRGNENIGKVITNVNATGGVGIGKGGDYKVENNNVSIEQRLKKMETTKEDIYRIGKGFDNSVMTNASGSVTNEAIKASQKRLQNKVKGKIVYLNVMLEWMLELILIDISSKGLGEYPVDAIEIEYTHDLIESDRDNAETRKIQAEATKTKLDYILSVEHLIGTDKATELISNILEIDAMEVKGNVRLESYGDVIDDVLD